MYCVQHWSKNYGRTYGCNYGGVFFNTENEAIDYAAKCESRTKIVELEWKEKKLPLQSFPLKIGLPIIVSRK